MKQLKVPLSLVILFFAVFALHGQSVYPPLGAENYHPLDLDMNGDMEIDDQDVVLLLDSWGMATPQENDLNNDGIIDEYDVSLLAYHWGEIVVTSLHRVDQKKLQVYPNPAVDFLNVSIGGADCSNILLINSQGAIVPFYTEKSGENTCTISTGQIPAGLYVLFHGEAMSRKVLVLSSN